MAAEQENRKVLVTHHPFWTQLSPLQVKQRVDQILEAPNSTALIRALSPVEYTVLLKEAPEMRSTLLALAHPQQIRTVLDLDCWDKDTLRSTQVLEWLEELQHSGSDVFVRAMQELDTEMLIATLRTYIRVHAILPIEEEEEPRIYDEVLANELYRLEFLHQDSGWNERVLRLLSLLRMTDLDLYHNLMQGTMWGQDNELEEWAYRWKSGRLQDEGFLDYYEALETYRLIDIDQPLPRSSEPLRAPGLTDSAEESRVIPSYAWSMAPAGSLLARSLAEDFSVETQDRLAWEMVYLCNRELVVDQIDFADAAAVRASLSRVHASLNVGLEYLSQQNTQRLVPLLTEHSLQSIYQVGFTLSMRLHQRALRLQTHLNRATGIRRALPGLTRQALDGLLWRHPQFFEGLEQPGTTAYRDFVHTQDITIVDPVLTHLEHDPAYRLFDLHVKS